MEPKSGPSLKPLLADSYYPFGSQYYRAPSPPPEDWDRDLKSMADLGFNMVKFWVQWRWNHPEVNRFYFDDIDSLMDLSEKYGLKVMLNTIVDVAPAWIYTNYPDASMLTLDGRRIGPQTQSHRQIGGLGVCLNHREVMGHLFRFLEETLKRYSDHPALEIWNVGSEPELTQSMSEMRLYADDARRMGDMLCYCEHCANGFRKWLQKKYVTVDQLNVSWNRNYASFEEAELPKTRNTFNDIIDWRMFFVDVLGDNVRRRFEVARSIDQGRHPLMCHHVFIQGFPVTSTANDPWNVGQYGDLHGFTQMDDAMMHDILRSCARGKPVMSAEMLMLMGYTLNLHRNIDANDIKRHVFTGVAADLKGFVFWQYRPEMLGREAPAWGLSHLDGSMTPWLASFAEVGSALQDKADFFHAARNRPAEVALLYNPKNQVFAWASTGSEKSATDSLLGTHRALYERNFCIDFLHPDDFEKKLPSGYKVIVVPFPYLLSERICDVLKSWVAEGGTLIAESYFGAWNMEAGRHHTTIPGYGFDEVFGVRQTNVEPPADHEYVVIDGVARASGGYHVRPGISVAASGGFVSAQPLDSSRGLGQVDITTIADLRYVEAGTRVVGAMVKEVIEVVDAEVLATYADGEPAVTVSSYGRGRAILVGSFVGLPYHRLGHPSNGAFIAGLVDFAADISRPHVNGSERVRVDVMRSDSGEIAVIVQNLEQSPVVTTVKVPDAFDRQLRELFTSETLAPVATADGTLFMVSLQPNEVQVFHG